MNCSSPIYCMKFYDENLVASGDDEGEIKIWDVRDMRSAVFKHLFNEHTDFVSDLLGVPSENLLFATGFEYI